MDNKFLNRVPPQNIEAEQAVIGAMLLDKHVVPSVIETLASPDFYKAEHRAIFDAITELFSTGDPIDLITVSDRLKAAGMLEKVGGISYLANMANSLPTTASTKHYAKIVEEKAILRRLITASSTIMDMGYEASEEVSHVLDRAEQSIFDLIEKRSSQGVYHIKDVLVDAFNRLEYLYNNKAHITGVPTGFSDFDFKTAGLQNSDLILVAARPAMGKTAFALNIAEYAAIHGKIPVTIFSLEMSKEQLANRIMCSRSEVNNQKMRTGRLEDNDWHKVAQAVGPLSESGIYIDDTAGINVMQIKAKCRKLKLEKKLGLVVIDYLQLMQGERRNEGRHQEVSEISRSLKIMAKELDVPVVALSQLSRAPEQRTDHRPILSDLRESGAIEQDADLVVFLYRDDYYNPDTEKKNVAEIIIAKHRNGSTGVVELKWQGEYTKFLNLERQKGQA